MMTIQIDLPLEQIKDLIHIAEYEQLTVDLCIRRLIMEHMEKFLEEQDSEDWER